jgi:hypothetical protein
LYLITFYCRLPSFKTFYSRLLTIYDSLLWWLSTNHKNQRYCMSDLHKNVRQQQHCRSWYFFASPKT